jgi:probable addiction module antidote protein
MALNTTPWDSAAHLNTDEDIQLYLQVCLEEAEGDPAFIIHALQVIARAKNENQVVEAIGLKAESSDQTLSSGENSLTFATVAKTVKALGFKLTVQPLT